MELPSHALGFQPPAEAISPIGHESWFGIREMCKTAYDLEPPFPGLEETVHNGKLFVNAVKSTLQQATATTTVNKPPTYNALMSAMKSGDLVKQRHGPPKC